MLVTTPISIDLVRKNFTQFLYATQDDGNTRAIEATITVNDQPWAVPEGTVGAVSFKKPDKTSGLYDTLPDGVTKAVTFVGNKVTAILAPQVLTAAGDTTVSIALYDDSLNRLGIFPFVLRVERNPSAGQAISNNYYNFSTLAALNDAIGDLAQLKTTNKGSLVAAINELKQGGTGGGGGNDSGQNPTAGTGWTTEQINLLDQLFDRIPWTAAGSGAIADALIASLRNGDTGGEDSGGGDGSGDADVTLTRISATYIGGDVPAGTAVADLSGITVTAHYSDGSSRTVTGYTLSGTIAEGSNTVTVTYQGMTTTFVVIGTAVAQTYAVTNNLTNVVNSNTATTVSGHYSATLTWESPNTLNTISITMGGVDVTADVYGEGTILITDVTGDIIITAVAGLPAPVYLLENKTFDGSAGQIIDTGIALFDTDKDWAVFASAETEDTATDDNKYIFQHLSKEATYPDGIAVYRTAWGKYWLASAVTGGSQISDDVANVACVITHTKGVGNHVYYAVVGGELVSGKLSTRGTGTDKTLKIGGAYDYEDANEQRLFKGTVKLLEIHDRVLTDAEIKERLGVE